MGEIDDRLKDAFDRAGSWHPVLPADALAAVRRRADRRRAVQRALVVGCTMLVVATSAAVVFGRTGDEPTRTVRAADDPSAASPSVVDDLITDLTTTTTVTVPATAVTPTTALNPSPARPPTSVVNTTTTTTARPAAKVSPLDQPGIYTIRPDGTGLRKLLVDADIRPRSPRFSPDGGTIAFFSGSNLEVIDADGSGRRRIAENTYPMQAPSWSRDGKRIAFFADDTGTSLRVVDVATSDEVFTLSQRGAVAFDWSPDGTSLVVVTNGGTVGIYAIDGSDERTIVNNPRMGRVVRWSRDGSTIIYTSMVDAPMDLHAELWAVDPDGNAPRNLGRVTNDQHVLSWSPDGSTIALTDAGASNDTGTTYLVSPTGVGRRALAERAAFPTWSPSGDRIAVQTSHPYDLSEGGMDPGFAIVVLDTSGTVVRTLIEAPYTPNPLTGDPQWSPKGDQIIFTATRNNAFGSAPRR